MQTAFAEVFRVLTGLTATLTHNPATQELKCRVNTPGNVLLAPVGTTPASTDHSASKKERNSILQLSGGQRTCLSLAFLFGALLVKPAPFYLLDEVDAALDLNHRAKLAQFLQQNLMGRGQGAGADGEDPSEGGGAVDPSPGTGVQILATTFRPQLVGVADRVFVVEAKDRVSRVRLAGKKDLAGIVKD